MSGKFKQVMLSEKDMKLINKIADLLKEEEGERPKKAAVIRKALNYYLKNKFEK